jgi:hypothetical protein
MQARSLVWLTCSIVTLLLAAIATVRVQLHDETPPLSLLIGVNAPGSSEPTSVQYVIMEDAPFIRMRYPAAATKIIVSDLLFSQRAQQIANSVGDSEDEEPFFSDDAIGNFFENLGLVVQRLVSNYEDDRRTDRGLPQVIPPFPDGLPTDDQNDAVCVLRKSDEIDRYSWEPVPAHTVERVTDMSADEVAAFDAKFGMGASLFQIDVSRLPLAGPADPNVLRDIWCRLRRPATADKFCDRSLEIWNGPRQAALREDTNGAPNDPNIVPLFVLPPDGWGARDVLFSPQSPNPSPVFGSQLIKNGEEMQIRWTEGYSAGITT